MTSLCKLHDTPVAGCCKECARCHQSFKGIGPSGFCDECKVLNAEDVAEAARKGFYGKEDLDAHDAQ